MRYADTLLTTGETIVVRERQHWLALLLESKTALALFLLAVVTWLLGVLLDTTAPGLTNILGYVALASLLIGLLILVFRAWQWWAQDYLITNRRILKVEGIINKRSADSSLEKINDAVLEQNLFARLFGYGDLDILTAADTAIDRYRMLNHAPAFKREMLNQKHNLEMEFSYRQPPSPPIRAGAPPGSGPVAEPPRPASGDDASEEVMRTLSRLADLRDRGAITHDEYEAKKQELLGRL